VQSQDVAELVAAALLPAPRQRLFS
jgi:hypothetical protein